MKIHLAKKNAGIARGKDRYGFIDMTGNVYGSLTVLRWAGKKKWVCRCDCGHIGEFFGHNVRRGKAQSCGCLKNVTHGHVSRGKVSREYSSWANMHTRCNNPNFKQRENYGGRGITVCQQWKSFEAFLADMGPRPAGTTLDRWPNPNGNYEPGNCRWATKDQQSWNKSVTRILFVNGKALNTKQASEMFGNSRGLIRCRLHKGWSDEMAVLTPVLEKGVKIFL